MLSAESDTERIGSGTPLRVRRNCTRNLFVISLDPQRVSTKNISNRKLRPP